MFCWKMSADAMDPTANSITILNNLREIVVQNVDYFTTTIRDKEEKTVRFHRCFIQLAEYTALLEPIVILLTKNAPRYDFDSVPANGFRSVLAVCDANMTQLTETSLTIHGRWFDIRLRKKEHLRVLEERTRILGSMVKMLTYASHLIDENDVTNNTNSLHPKDGSKLVEEWYNSIETLDQEVFYGRSLGFQYCTSLQIIMQGIVSAMAVCSQTYGSWEKWRPGSANIALALPNPLTALPIVLKPTLRAKQIVAATRNADVTFCKQFWDIKEDSIMQFGINLFMPYVVKNIVMELPPESLVYTNATGKNFLITPPSPSKPVYTRFITNNQTTMSSSLIFHCHGGGFIAQSSKAHQGYLLKWSKDLKVPVLSVDYALAPEFIYPQPVDEVVYAYIWALINHAKLGWTGEKVCFVGDSAGGNMIVAACLKCYSMGLPMPTGLVAAYGVFLVQYTPSPSRLLSLMDPILPLGILTRCLAAYAGVPEPELVQGANDKVASSDQPPKSVGPPTSPGRMGFESSNSQVDPLLTEWDMLDPVSTGRYPKPSDQMHDGYSRSSQNQAKDPLHMRKVEPLHRYNFESIAVANAFLSPLLADDHLLSGLPPVYLLACQLDPLLDDSISLARRLHQLNKIVDVDVVNLPHGFLSLSKLVPEIAHATALCTKRIQQVLDLH